MTQPANVALSAKRLVVVAAIVLPLLVMTGALARTSLAQAGTDGDDVQAGTPGDDIQNGDAGRDVLHGAHGNDRQTGGTEHDALKGGLGDDLQEGGASFDALIGNAGADTQLGGPGDDSLVPGAGRDRVNGGGGDDVIVTAGDSPTTRDRVVCGSGRDAAWASARDVVARDCERVYRGSPRLPLPPPRGFASRAPAVSVGGCNLVPHTRCPGVNLRAAALTGLDLTGAVFTDGNLIVAGLTRTILAGADISGASFLTSAVAIQADFTGANLSGAWSPFVMYTAAKLTNLTGIGVKLSFADLTAADLTGANLLGADLEYATFQGANLTGANLSGAKTTGTKFAGAKFCNTTMPDGTINNSNC